MCCCCCDAFAAEDDDDMVENAEAAPIDDDAAAMISRSGSRVGRGVERRDGGAAEMVVPTAAVMVHQKKNEWCAQDFLWIFCLGVYR